MKKVLAYIMMSAMILVLFAACGQADEPSEESQNGEMADEKKVLKMGTSADYPPFEYVDTTKGEEIIGFDVDLARAITEKLGYDIEIQDIDFVGLIDALNSGRVDFVLAGMSATDKRRESVDFSDIYYTANHKVLFSKESNFKSLEDLTGKTVGVQLGSIQEEKAKELQETLNIKVESRNRVPEIIQEIKAGRFDAVIVEDVVGDGYLEKNEDLAGFQLLADEENGFAVAFPKGSDDLVAQFNQVIQEMKENGELNQLIYKWFGGEQ